MSPTNVTNDQAIQIAVNKFKQTSCYKRLSALCADAAGCTEANAKNVQFADQIESICREEGFLVLQELEWKQVGAMPGNRGGEGLDLENLSLHLPSRRSASPCTGLRIEREEAG